MTLNPDTVPARDRCVVDVDPLAGLIGVFVGDWERSRPKSDGSRHGNEPTVRSLRAIEWLSIESGISERRITDVMKQKRETVDLGVADALVAAVGHPEAFYDGTLHVSCCGGSTRSTT